MIQKPQQLVCLADVYLFFDRCQVSKSLPCVACGNRHESGYDAANIETNEAWCQVCDLAED